MTSPRRFSDADACAEALIERLGGRIRLALPLGLGKPVMLANALYRRARQHPEIELDIYTALTLEIPRPRSELEARLLGPLVERLYGDVPELDYAVDQRRRALPDNVRLTEFYFRPGGALDIPAAQHNYVSSNYTHAARDLANRGINVIAQMVAPAAGVDAGNRYSFSCNPDLTRDLMDAARSITGRVPLLVGEANRALPYLPGSAELQASELDLLLEAEHIAYELFPVPNRAVGLAEQVIGLRVATLIRDGGTLQIGIGSVGDAVAHAVALRRTDNTRFRALVKALEITAPQPELDELPQGLYGASEMFVEGFLHLREQGVLSRTVDDGIYLHGGFFLGSKRFYERLRQLPEGERRGIAMTRISFTNSLLGNEPAKRRHRRHARFVNTTMMMTLLGAAASDALEDGRVVSGVGGQYNFVAMAHELADGRSILVLPATRTANGTVTSNIVWRYGHVTIPRHLRDLVVTEYGVAELRGASDQDVVVALLNLADSRFQERLRRQAVAAGKLPGRYRIPERFRHNHPERLARDLAHAGLLEALPWYPLQTDLTAVEAELAIALASLGDKQGNPRALIREVLDGWRLTDQPRLQPALQRMGLARPRGIRQRVYQALLAAALVREVHDHPRPLFPLRHP
jgi:acyl-CoA hydrolase